MKDCELCNSRKAISRLMSELKGAQIKIQELQKDQAIGVASKQEMWNLNKELKQAQARIKGL